MKWFNVWLICCLVTGCAGKSNVDGADIIPKPEMAKVIWDIMQVDEFATTFIVKDTLKNLKMERIKLYQQVFRLHKVSEKKFSSSYKYYSGHPEMMKMLFDTLSSRAEKERIKQFMPDSTKAR